MPFTYIVEIEMAGKGDAPAAETLAELSDRLGGAPVTGTPTSPDDELARFGATLTIDDCHDVTEAAVRGLRSLRTEAEAAGLEAWSPASLRVVTEAQADLELSRPPAPAVVGISEIANMLGVSRQRASAIAARDDFPPPAAKLAAGPVWTHSAVAAWERTWERKSGRPRVIVAPRVMGRGEVVIIPKDKTRSSSTKQLAKRSATTERVAQARAGAAKRAAATARTAKRAAVLAEKKATNRTAKTGRFVKSGARSTKT